MTVVIAIVIVMYAAVGDTIGFVLSLIVEIYTVAQCYNFDPIIFALIFVHFSTPLFYRWQNITVR